MDTNLLLKTYLKRLRLPAMARELEKIAAEAASANLVYERFLLLLAEHEVLAREQNTLRQRLRVAGFPVLKTLDSYDFSSMPSLPKAEVLRAAQGEYIAQTRNIVLAGNPGTGKTHLAIGLGIAACRQGYRVRFFTAAGLVTALLEARAENRLSRLERKLAKCSLVVVDELGYVPFSREGADLLFAFCSDRYERGALLITSNLEFDDWPRIFGDPQLTGALVDRLTHHAILWPMIGDSYRLRQAQARQQGVPGRQDPPPLRLEEITAALAPTPQLPPRRRGRPPASALSQTAAVRCAGNSPPNVPQRFGNEPERGRQQDTPVPGIASPGGQETFGNGHSRESVKTGVPLPSECPRTPTPESPPGGIQDTLKSGSADPADTDGPGTGDPLNTETPEDLLAEGQDVG
jgi:DNA replication protein DnaC